MSLLITTGITIIFVLYASLSITEVARIQTSNITSKGQVTIPASMRKKFGLVAGKQVAFRLENGKIVIELVEGGLSSLFGLIESDRSVSLAEMDEAVVATAAEQFEKDIEK